ELSWPMVGGVFALPKCRPVPVAQYNSSAATFDPRQWDAPDLARRARAAGMRYGVLTAKHHSGYAMFHTRASTFSVEHSPFGRDIVAEFVDAFRSEGLRVGLYYSLSDWSHPDYPAFADDNRPYSFGLSPSPSADGWARYVDYLFAQVAELLTNYGQIDVLWFDGGWERSAEQWHTTELDALIRSLQPDILVNDRLPGGGDFDTPEQFVPPVAPARRWETCLTMNDSWGWCPSDTDYKSARSLVHALCEVRSRRGNLLLNVSPTGDGALPREQVDRLDAIGAWMDANGESVHDVEPGLEPWQFYGPTTRRGDTVYLQLLMRPYDEVVVRGVHPRRARRARALGSGAALDLSERVGVLDRLTQDPVGELRITLPPTAIDDLATVVAVEFAGGP
ncbi:MAG TPA: alpha-L-fucosidase, partial [Mycobacteriales bacterium]|nr:alpha-L-fucosidase [Mycobacteriales bacterium]